jgi:hypothetical protein
MRGVTVGAIGSLLVALAVGGCSATPSHSAGGTTRATRTTSAPGAARSSTTSTGNGGSPATRPSSPAGASPAVTQVGNFNPWNAAGALSSSLHATTPVSGGSCAQSSAFDVGNANAWRCTVPSGGFLDPCFAPPGRTAVAQVACGESPWSAYTVLTLSTPLASSSWGTPADNQSYPWAMVLANGQHCGLIDGTGAEIDGASFNFGCTVGYASYPKTATQPWTAAYAAASSGPATSVGVTTAWS